MARGNALELRSAIGDVSDDLTPAPDERHPDGNRFEVALFSRTLQAVNTLSARERIFARVEAEVGPVLQADAAPKLAATVLEIFGNLSQAQDARAAAHDVLSVNELFFVDAPVENAFVSPQADRGVRLMRSLSFVTTGVMRTALGIDSGDLESDDPIVAARGLEKFKVGLSAIAGLAAHELAHPLDDIDGDGYTRTANKEGARHAIELKADIQGVLLLRDAGYPVGGLRDALALFVGRDTASIGHAAASTHPPSDLRIITLELAETLARYEHGPAKVTRPFAVDLAEARAMSAELRGLEAYRKRWEFEPSNDYATTLRRLAALSNREVTRDRPKSWAMVEQNRLLLRLGAQLDERENAGNPPTRDELDTLLSALAKLDQPVADTSNLPRLMNATHVSEQFAREPSFRARAERFKFLRTPEARASLAKLRPVRGASEPDPEPFSREDVRRSLAKQLDIVRIDNRKPWHQNLAALTRFCRLLPADLAADFMKGELEAMFSDLLSDRLDNMGLQSDAPLASLPNTVRMTLAARYINDHLGDDPDLLTALGGSGQLGPSNLLPLESNKLKPRASRLRATMRTPAYASVAADYRAAMAKVWERRGPLACGNAFADERIDWHLIAELAGVTTRDVDADVRAAVQEHIGVRKLPRPTGAATARPPSWLDARSAGRYMTWLAGAAAAVETPSNGALAASDDARGAHIEALFATAGFEGRLRLEFDASGKHNAYVVRTREVIRAGVASGTNDWLGVVLGNEKGLLLHAAPRPTARLVELILTTVEDLLPPKKRLAFLDTSLIPKVSAVVAGSPRLIRQLTAFRERAGGSSQAIDFVTEFARHAPSQTVVQLIGSCGPQLAAELTALHEDPVHGRHVLSELAELLDMQRRPGALTAEGLHPVKAALVELARTLANVDALALHAKLASTGPTRATDAYCVDKVLPAASQSAVEKLLRSSLLYSDQLRLDLAMSVIESRWPSASAKLAERSIAISQNLERFNDYAPGASRQRDDFLEQLGWRFGLRSRELNAFVEDQKSANWRRANPLLVRLGSAGATAIAKFDWHTRHVFIDALIHRKRGEPFVVPREVRRAISESTNKPLGPELSEDFGTPRHTPSVIALLEQHISDASPVELIPLIAMVIRSGVNALTREPSFPRNVMHHLGHEPGSERAITLDAFLETLPAHEHAVTLAYFMSQEGDARDYVSGFEVFDAPGIMVGQLAHTFGLVEGVQALKNDAKRLSKATIHAELAELPRATRNALDDRINEYTGIVGSAKLKTVIEVKLDDGRRAALMVRRPNVEAKVEANFAQGRAFITSLERRGVKLPLKLVRALVDAAETQMRVELDFRHEASRLAAMRTTLSELNRAPGLMQLLDGWRFAVPQLIEGVPAQESMLLTEFAEGVPFIAKTGEPQLDGPTRAALGPALVKASLMLLFRYGTFEADRHLGNWRFDPATKTINFIDIGQLTDFSRGNAWKDDDRLVFARFVTAWSRKDAAGLTDAFFAMRKGGAAVDSAKVERALGTVLADRSLEGSAQLARLAEAALESGVELEHRFLFGGVKGLMVLASEGYVDAGTFAEIMRDEIRGLVKQKAPAVAAQALKGMLAGRGLRIA